MPEAFWHCTIQRCQWWASWTNVQKLLTKQNALHTTHATLCQDVPSRFKSAIGDNTNEVNDMVNNHAGQVRELDGVWVRMDGEVPKPRTHDGAFYHAPPHGPSGWRGLGTELPDHTADSEGRYNLILAHQPAVGGEEGFKVRVCKVISLAELFWISATSTPPTSSMRTTSTLAGWCS